MAILFFINGVSLGSWLPRLPELRDRLDLTLTEVGLTLAAAGVGGLIGSGFSGTVVGRWGPLRTAVAPALILMLFLPLVAVAPSAPLLAVVVGLAGSADAVADVGMNAMAVRVEQDRGRSIMSRFHALWSLGSLAGSVVSAAALAGGVSLSVQLIGTAFVGAGAVAAAGRLLPAPLPRPRPRAHRKVALALAVAGGMVAVAEGAPLDWSAIYLTDVVGTGTTIAGVGFLVYTVGMVSGRLTGDLVIDRLGGIPALLGGLGVVAAGMVIVTTSSAAVVAMAGLVLWGLGISVVLPLLYRLAGSHPGFGEGVGLAALTVGNRVGFMAGSGLIGSVAAIATLPISLTVVVGTALAGATVAVVVGLSRRPDAIAPPRQAP